MATHHFEPTQFHTTIGWHEPVLHIAPGDTVVTSTIDAGGRDAGGERVIAGGNPQTGPFFVEGAEPGDTLVVHIDRLTPNRKQGYSRSVVAPNVVDPEFVTSLTESEVIFWQVDTSSGVVRLADSAGSLADLRLTMDPMIGCFGVAPRQQQAISTATSAEHGGNMDYRGFRQGVTIYLPIFAPGALFHLGDCHAVQGDGEIVGTGVEISCDVQFTIDLRKNWKTSWPRGENADEIFTVGNARPLDQALQHATTEMIKWLGQDYHLDVGSASTLLGQSVAYDLGNVFDPAYTMVCKVAKHLLIHD